MLQAHTLAGTHLLCTKPCAWSWHGTQPVVPPCPQGDQREKEGKQTHNQAMTILGLLCSGNRELRVGEEDFLCEDTLEALEGG